MESVKSVPGESVMSVKIRISFTEDEELAGVIRLLSPALKSYKVSKKKEGKYQNAYADLHPGFQNDEPGEDAEQIHSFQKLSACGRGVFHANRLERGRTGGVRMDPMKNHEGYHDPTAGREIRKCVEWS